MDNIEVAFKPTFLWTGSVSAGFAYGESGVRDELRLTGPGAVAIPILGGIAPVLSVRDSDTFTKNQARAAFGLEAATWLPGAIIASALSPNSQSAPRYLPIVRANLEIDTAGNLKGGAGIDFLLSAKTSGNENHLGILTAGIGWTRDVIDRKASDAAMLNLRLGYVNLSNWGK